MAVWAGDPQLHPPVGAALAWHVPIGAERIVASVDAAGAGWWCAARTALDLLEAGHPAVVVFDAAAVGVLGRFDELLDGGGRFVARVDGPVPDDGRWPTADDLERMGRVTPSIASFAPDDRPCLEWLLDRLAAGTAPSEALTLAAERHDVASEVVAGIGVGTWRWEAAPRVVDLTGFDPDQPWVLDPRADRPARVRLVGHDDRSAAVAAAAEQLAGVAAPLVAPGGIPLDESVRRLLRDDPAAPLPWSEPAAFRAWLADRWWAVQRRTRPISPAPFRRARRATPPSHGGANGPCSTTARRCSSRRRPPALPRRRRRRPPRRGLPRSHRTHPARRARAGRSSTSRATRASTSSAISPDSSASPRSRSPSSTP